jgi:hypothetical protein
LVHQTAAALQRAAADSFWETYLPHKNRTKTGLKAEG